MTRRKVQLALIINAAKRKASCKRRKNGLMRKLNELIASCGVDACAIIHCSELNPQLEFWPSKSDVERVVVEFQNLSLRERTENMVDQKTTIKKKIVKAEKELEKLLQANREKKLTQVIFDSMVGRPGLQYLDIEELEALARLVDKKMYDVEKRIESLNAEAMAKK